MMDWVSVKDRLPELFEWVAAFNGSDWMKACYNGDGDWQVDDSDYVVVTNITYWMEVKLPQFDEADHPDPEKED